MIYNPKGFNIPENLPAAFGPFGLEYHQVAIYTSDVRAAALSLTTIGFTGWSFDVATLKGTYNDVPCTIHAEMAFNYQMLHGKELEFVHYEGHPIERYAGSGQFLSHISAYVDDVDLACREIERLHGIVPIHKFETSNHLNPRVAGKKHFREALFETTGIGFNIKLIEKVID